MSNKKLEEVGESKYIPLSNMILSKDGWKKAKDIFIGEYVYGLDGVLHKVVNIEIKHNQNIYNLTFKDGTSVKLCEKSILRVVTKKQEENMRKYGDERYCKFSRFAY